jgi:hypothetical protein
VESWTVRWLRKLVMGETAVQLKKEEGEQNGSISSFFSLSVLLFSASDCRA